MHPKTVVLRNSVVGEFLPLTMFKLGKLVSGIVSKCERGEGLEALRAVVNASRLENRPMLHAVRRLNSKYMQSTGKDWIFDIQAV